MNHATKSPTTETQLNVKSEFTIIKYKKHIIFTNKCYHAQNDKVQLVIKKGKASSLDIVPLTILNSGASQPRKWQLTGTADCSTAPQAVAAQSPR